MIYLFYVVHVVICLFLILVVLLQQGKGADLSVFGGGGTMTAFGARGAATLLHKMTVYGFIGFILTTLTIGVLQKQGDGSSVMSEVPAVEEEAATEEAVEAEGALPEAEPEDAGILPEAEEFDEGVAAEDGTGENGTGEDGPSEDAPGEGDGEGSEP